MMTSLAHFAHALQSSADFEAAARVTLDRLLAVTALALDRPSLGRTKVRRALLHLRPERGYAGLWVLEAGADGLSEPDARSALLPSASVWRRLASGRAPVAVDVNLRTMQALDGAVEAGQWLDEDGLSDRSRARLLERDATHACALPLYAPGALGGMVSIEVSCRAAIGRPFVWGECRAELEATLAVAGPYLTSLSPRRVEGVEVDPLLPVIGATMAPRVRVLRAFAAEEETLLIRGETGTGKSRIARWCHAHSARAAGPFEVLDLLSVPPETQMGELFGWRKGAFTGAVRDHDGFVARAEGGTLFIDEIDKLSLEAQAALLHLLEERRYRVLGQGGRRFEADVRFVVGTNTDLVEAVAAGRFREDLYYRINVLPMELPALRERRDEIGGWARFMVQRCHAARGGAGEVTLGDDAVAALAARAWPGNLRQLDNIVRRAYTLGALDPPATGVGRHVERRHVEDAEGLESGRRAEATPVVALLDAAVALAAQIEGRSVDFDGVEWPGALHGLMLAAAVLHTGDRDAAFRLLGHDSMVSNRNHHKAFHRDIGRLIALLERLGETPPEVLRGLLS